MINEKIRAALSAVVEAIKDMGPDAFRAEINAREAGQLAHAFAEIEAFASAYLPVGVVVSSAILEAIHWGVGFQQDFDPVDFERWIAANDARFALAA